MKKLICVFLLLLVLVPVVDAHYYSGSLSPNTFEPTVYYDSSSLYKWSDVKWFCLDYVALYHTEVSGLELPDRVYPKYIQGLDGYEIGENVDGLFDISKITYYDYGLGLTIICVDMANPYLSPQVRIVYTDNYIWVGSMNMDTGKVSETSFKLIETEVEEGTPTYQIVFINPQFEYIWNETLQTYQYNDPLVYEIDDYTYMEYPEPNKRVHEVESEIEDGTVVETYQGFEIIYYDDLKGLDNYEYGSYSFMYNYRRYAYSTTELCLAKIQEVLNIRE